MTLSIFSLHPSCKPQHHVYLMCPQQRNARQKWPITIKHMLYCCTFVQIFSTMGHFLRCIYLLGISRGASKLPGIYSTRLASLLSRLSSSQLFLYSHHPAQMHLIINQTRPCNLSWLTYAGVLPDQNLYADASKARNTIGSPLYALGLHPRGKDQSGQWGTDTVIIG